MQAKAEYMSADIIRVENGWQQSYFDKVTFSKVFIDTTVIKYKYYNFELSLLSQIDFPIGLHDSIMFRSECSPLS